jgi:hypothetical protein
MLSNSGKAVVISALTLVVIAAIVLLTRQGDSTATAGSEGTATSAAGGGAKEDGPRSASNMCRMTPCLNAPCDACTNENCTPATDGCNRFIDPAERKLCEDLYACITDPANHCTNQGDPVKCWCGTNPTTCLGNATGPKAANGPCLQQVLAAGKTTDPGVIRARFVDAIFPIGAAIRLSSCRGSFCSKECGVP